MVILRFSAICILILPMCQAQNLTQSPIEILVEWVATTEKFVDDGLVFIKDISRYVHNNVELANNQFVNFTRLNVDFIWSGIEGELNSIKQSSNADLQLAIDCIISNKDDLKAVPFDLFTEVVRCISGSTRPVTNVTQYICSDLQRVQKKVKIATGQLKKCTGSTEKVFNCTVEVTLNVIKALQTIPTEVGGDWLIFTDYFESLKEEYESCLECDVEQARKKSIKAFEHISTCIISTASNRSHSDDGNNSHRGHAPLFRSGVLLIVLLSSLVMVTSKSI